MWKFFIDSLSTFVLFLNNIQKLKIYKQHNNTQWKLIFLQIQNRALDCCAECCARTNSNWMEKVVRSVSVVILAAVSSVQDRRPVNWKRCRAPRSRAHLYPPVSPPGSAILSRRRPAFANASLLAKTIIIALLLLFFLILFFIWLKPNEKIS